MRAAAHGARAQGAPGLLCEAAATSAACHALHAGLGMTEACRHRCLVRAADAVPALRFG
jgi:hypothetical protein